VLKQLEITILKTAAKKHYNAYHDALDNYSCGAGLAEHISPSVRTHKRKFNNAMDKLSKIDPSAPTTRL